MEHFLNKLNNKSITLNKEYKKGIIFRLCQEGEKKDTKSQVFDAYWKVWAWAAVNGFKDGVEPETVVGKDAYKPYKYNRMLHEPIVELLIILALDSIIKDDQEDGLRNAFGDVSLICNVIDGMANGYLKLLQTNFNINPDEFDSWMLNSENLLTNTFERIGVERVKKIKKEVEVGG
jgi:hypothetical protein